MISGAKRLNETNEGVTYTLAASKDSAIAGVKLTTSVAETPHLFVKIISPKVHANG
jgi:hypothetical protein